MLIRLILVLALLASVSFAARAGLQSAEDPVVVFTRRQIAHAKTKTYRPIAGYVPDAKTAIAIAVAVLTPIYGKAEIQSDTPWHTGLENDVWTVVGTFNGKSEGGEPIVQIEKQTGMIRFVGHSM